MAPETTIDFDAPHVSTKEVLAMFFGAFAFFGTLYSVVAFSDPVGSNPVALEAQLFLHPLCSSSRGRGIVRR